MPDTFNWCDLIQKEQWYCFIFPFMIGIYNIHCSYYFNFILIIYIFVAVSRLFKKMIFDFQEPYFPKYRDRSVLTWFEGVINWPNIVVRGTV
jgi:hypothetical protein